MIALRDLAWMAQGAEDRPSVVVRTGTSLGAAAGWFGHHGPAAEEAMAVHGGRRAVHWGRCECGLARRADEGRRRARGRMLAPEMRLG